MTTSLLGSGGIMTQQPKRNKTYDELIGIMTGYQQMIVILTAKQQSNGNPDKKTTLYINKNNTSSSNTRTRKN